MRISDWSSDVCSSVLRWLFARLPEWEEQPPRPPPRQVTHDADAVAARLDRLTGDGADRPAERRAGKECVSTGRSRAWPYQPNTKTESTDDRGRTDALNTPTYLTQTVHTLQLKR